VVRISVGIEHVDDIIGDLERGLSALWSLLFRGRGRGRGRSAAGRVAAGL